MAAVVACIGWGTWWLLKKESFAYTHYPMRFNRKTRMVHVFRPGGTVLSVPWDEVFFTLGHMPQWNEWEVRGHVIEADRTTVRESFALSYLGSMSPADAELGRTHFSDQDFVRAHWEFVRRFMEEGPQAVSSQVQFCMPVSGRRELARVSMERAFANIAGANIVLYWMLFPFCLAVGLGRVLAVRTSKIPRWPADVEASCRSASAPLDQLRRELAPMGLGVAVPLGFNNTYALATRGDGAPRTLSGLAGQGGYKFGLSHEFIGRADGWPGLAAGEFVRQAELVA
eukprot:gene31729-35817_t